MVVMLDVCPVSIHAPAWGATHVRSIAQDVGEVSIHAPAWGATRTYGRRRSTTSCFNPRTRVGCDARGRCAGWPRACFNPRTRVGCDPTAWRFFVPFSCFNPRTRVGCDIGAQLVLTQAGGVSIHAPAWGATWEELDRFRYYSVFQSTHPRGVRRLANTHSFDEIMFQSTHPRGVRRGKQHQGAGRSPVSIHAPAWGATRNTVRSTVPDMCFNPRTRVGCDRPDRWAVRRTGWFQSTHPRGVRLAPTMVAMFL